MTRYSLRPLLFIGLGLTLTACAQHNPAQANCFNFRDNAARSATGATTTISTVGEVVTRRDTACDFVLLGAGG